MNIKKNIKAVALILSVGIASLSFATAQAADSTKLSKHQDHKKWYLGAALGATQVEPRVTVIGGFVEDDQSNGFKLYGGYQFNKALSVEAFYADLGAANINVVTDNSDVDYQAYGVGLGYGFKLNSKLKLLGKLGVGSLENDIKEGFAFDQINKTTMYLGAGLEYRINQRLSWRAEYDYFDEDYQMLSAGLKLHF